jgi:hypothetical protein
VNIKELKTLVANLPEVIDEPQFEMLMTDVRRLEEQKRQADEAELARTLERAAELQRKLGKTAAPVVVPAPRLRPNVPATGLDLTDEDMGVLDEGPDVSLASFTGELAALRARAVARRNGRH